MRKYIVLISIIVFMMSCQDEKNKNNMNPVNESHTNPLLEEWTTPFGTPPFDKIKSEDYMPAMLQGIKEQDEEIANIIANTETPTFLNTIVAFEKTGKTLDRVSMAFDAVESANTNDVLKATSKKVRPMFAAHYDKMLMNHYLFEKINTVYKQKETLKLSAEDNRLLGETYKSFVRSGVNLEGSKQNRLKEINKILAGLTQSFGDNLLEETNNFELHTTDEKDLGDLPQNFIDAAAEEAKTRGHDNGWSFTLQRPSMYPFLQYSKNRDLREKLFVGYTLRGNNDNKHDNKKVIEEIVRLRTEKAHLLGYKTHAHYVLEENMAENPENVYELLNQILKPALEIAKRDRDLLAKSMKDEGVEGKFRASDWRYYVRKIRSEKYDFDEDQTRPYFEANAVMDGAFLLATKLFGLTFKERKDISTWHEDQQVFEVFDEAGAHVGIIYMDFYARASKRGGAWMNELRGQSNIDKFETPIVTNNFNFPAPTKGAPSLLSFSQAQTVFHEFGHGLHGLLSNVKYGSLAGTNVPRDFVEFPSQVIENWMSEPTVLKLYAKHYKTGEVIPDEMIKKMRAANSFDEGFRTIEYMAAATLDMDWHTLETIDAQETVAFEKASMDKMGLIEEIVPRYRTTYFGHIAGGYSAGYYSYLWSEILDADAFEAFKETGNVLDPEVAKRYKEMLSKGGTESGLDLYKGFRGRAPKIDALLKKKGF